MLLSLPEINNDKFSQIYNKNLYIKDNCDFNVLMNKLTYDLKENRCSYCNKVLTGENRTLDHVIPKIYGGVSIVDNLVPCCKECNVKKDFLLLNQFQEFLKIDCPKKQSEFKNEMKLENEKKLNESKLFLNEKWIKYLDLKEIPINTNNNYGKLKERNSKQYFKYLEFLRKNNTIYKPLILDKNFSILNGIIILEAAKKLKISQLPVISLENVCSLYFLNPKHRQQILGTLNNVR